MTRIPACLAHARGPDRHILAGPLPLPWKLTHCGRTYILTRERTQGDWPVYREV